MLYVGACWSRFLKVPSAVNEGEPASVIRGDELCE